MTIKKIKYNDTFLYVEDEIPDEEKGFVIKNNNLDETKELNLKEELNLLSDTVDYSNLSEELGEYVNE